VKSFFVCVKTKLFRIEMRLEVKRETIVADHVRREILSSAPFLTRPVIDKTIRLRSIIVIRWSITVIVR
jgi:hypothetical protein